MTIDLALEITEQEAWIKRDGLRCLKIKLRGTDARGYFLRAAKHDPAFALAYVGLERMLRSPWGRVLRAIREDELAAVLGHEVVGVIERVGPGVKTQGRKK